MELSQETLELIHIAGDAARIGDQVFSPFVLSVVESILDETKKSDVTAFEGSDAGTLKAAHAGLTILLLEAAKHDKDASSLSSALEDCKFTPDRIKLLTKLYQDKKAELRALLANIGRNPAHIVDVDWRLDYYIKNNHLEKVNQPTYIVSLKTEECDQDKQSDYNFACSQDQLQDLVGKLKDACKSLERASQF